MLKSFATPKPVNLGDKLAAAQAAIQGAQAAHEAASLLAETEDTPAARTAANATAADLRAAGERVASIRSAIAAADRREADRAADAKAADNAGRWRIVTDQCSVREAAARDVDAAADVLFSAWTRFANASTKIAETRVVADLDGGLLRSDALVAAFRCHTLLRAGFRWAAPAQWLPENLPPLAERIATANAHIATQRAA